MPYFLDRDFFADPKWPSEFEPKEKKKGFEIADQSSFKKYFFSQDLKDNQFSSSPMEPRILLEEDDDGLFLANTQNNTDLNAKQEDITYLDDQNKAFELANDTYGKQEISRERLRYLNFSDQKFQIKFEMEFERQINESLNDCLNENQNSGNRGQRNKNFCHNLMRREYLKRKKFNYSFNFQKQKNATQQSDLIAEVLDTQVYKQEKQQQQDKQDSQNIKDHKKQLEKIDKAILKKLKSLEQKKQTDCKLEESDTHNKRKSHRYKILTASEKQYLVHLSTLSTTCEVARRFNISVNNICRWKKGTLRKAGAGRKIACQELQQKVISFVKELISNDVYFTRKQIQSKARQLSQNKNFKASKGWFERFYTRNISIFTNLAFSKQ